MLSLKNIIKDYTTGDETVNALKGISVDFRENEFVSILGQSGCGKTTLLNIVGGLDRYTSGDLIINGKSTKEFKDKDWDTYRNHSIGFVFQSYNLIPHQTVLANVELALTLSGVSKSERKERAKQALEKVGLGNQLNKKPNQMSGGQMQRVAIARALVNDPDILLADEPTGALDSETSVAIMEILKEISKDKLIIMVTHNPELAEKYSSRIIRLLDGNIVSDTNPYTPDTEAESEIKKDNKKKKNMSFGTALNLSLNNLMTKKARTFLTSFAGSIGIIGIALILSLSNGVQEYINKIERETLSSYPLQIDQATGDMSAIFEAMGGGGDDKETTHDMDKIYTKNTMAGMMSTMMNGTKENNLTEFKKYIENDKKLEPYVNDIQYNYSTIMNIYKSDTSNGLVKVNPSTVMEDLGFTFGGNSYMDPSNTMISSQYNVWTQIPNNQEMFDSQYEIVAGRKPENYNELVVMVDENNEIMDYTLYSLGVLDTAELTDMIQAKLEGKTLKKLPDRSYSYEDILNLKFKLIVNTDYFKQNDDGTWQDMSDNEAYVITKLSDAIELKVVGIVRPNADSTGANNDTLAVGYRSDLMQKLVEEVNQSDIVKQQKDNKNIDVFTGLKFDNNNNNKSQIIDISKNLPENPTFKDITDYVATLDEKTAGDINSYIKMMKSQGMTDEEIAMTFTKEMQFSPENLTFEDIQGYISTLDKKQAEEINSYIEMMKGMGMSEEEIADVFAKEMQPSSENTYDGNLLKMGCASIDTPSSILIYPKDFEAKESICDVIKDYNSNAKKADQLTYTDYIGLLMSSVTTIINAISYILIAFVGISLIVSSIMIGIITYISVLERTKEIGILRAIGASKKDISRVFNAETFIIGLVSGGLGIGITALLLIPINIIIKHLVDISNMAILPPIGAIILIIISVVLTFVAGLLPSGKASRKDPVIALRSE